MGRNTSKKRIERKSVLIALEDTKSSKYYFQELIKDKNLSGEVIFAKHIGTDPLSVVDAIVRHKLQNPKVQYQREWAVFDRDSWTRAQVNGAISRAQSLAICVAISNEAYELWILLHFERLAAPTNRINLTRKLNEHFKERFGVEYSKSSQDVYRYVIGMQKTAIENAQYLVNHHISIDGRLNPERQNPLTLVHELVQCLNSLYSDTVNCECFPI